VTPREAVELSIVKFEGGESNKPTDRGGLTRYGLTFKTYLELVPKGTLDAFRALTRDEVIDLITEHFALGPGYFRIRDQWVMWLVIDFAINSGRGNATRALQRAIGVQDDGLFGRHTDGAVNSVDPARTFRHLVGERIEFLGRLITRDVNQGAPNAWGWMRRVSTILKAVP